LLGVSFATASSAAAWASSRVCSAGMTRLMVTSAVLLPAVPAASVRVMVPVMLPSFPAVALVLAYAMVQAALMSLFVIAPVTASRIWGAVKLLLGVSFATASSAAIWASSTVCKAGMVRLMVTSAVLLPAVPVVSVSLITPVMLPSVPAMALVLA